VAYRGGKALRGAPAGFAEFKASPTTRTPGEILAHMGDLLDWVLSQARGQERWSDSKPQSWEKDTRRFFAALAAFDAHLASRARLQAAPERLFQGAVADALTHVGQIALLRGLAGARVRGENYSRAKIAAGRTGPDQPAPVREFG
jgi:hypothetical protein